MFHGHTTVPLLKASLYVTTLKFSVQMHVFLPHLCNSLIFVSGSLNVVIIPLEHERGQLCNTQTAHIVQK